MRKCSFIMAMFAIIVPAFSHAVDFDGEKLSGKVIGTQYSVDYRTGARSTTVNTVKDAFDGDLNTFFASYDRSFTWVGLELDREYVVTGIGFAARNDGLGPGRTCLGVFQGANNADFSDAIPIYLIPKSCAALKMTYVDVNCSKGFRYLRYVGPHDARCNIAEIEFYGKEGAGDESTLYQITNIPTVVVNTPDMEWFHEDDKSYEMNGSTITVIADGKIDVSAPGQIRGRGNASWGFPKKPFRIKFDKKQKVLGGPATAKKWTMINNYGDKTLMRNMLAFELSRRIGMPYTPVCHPVDLVFNGEYQGTYQLCDQVEVNPGRVEIAEMKAKDTEGEALTGGYLIEIDAYADQEPADEWFKSGWGHQIPVTIKSPDPGVSQQYEYIKSRFNELERSVFILDFKNPEKGYRSKMDLDSFLRHFIVGETSGNTDTYWSVYMSLDRGADRFVVGPVWDFDIAFENDNRTYPINSKDDFVCFSGGSFANGMYDFVYQIIRRDPEAFDRLKYLWSDARVNRGYTEESFGNLIDEYSDMLMQSQRLNFMRWPIMGQYVHQNPNVWGSYDKEVANVRRYLTNRVGKLDNLIGRVEVEGVEDNVAENISVQPVASGIVISGSGHYTICNMQGMTVSAGEGDAMVSLAPGLYIVNTGDKAVKVVVKP